VTLVGLGWFETSGQDIHPTSTRHVSPHVLANNPRIHSDCGRFPARAGKRA